jgi:hypothetical protein
MGAVLVEDPAGNDEARPASAKCMLSCFTCLIPRISDGQKVADYLHGLGTTKIEWCLVRPYELENTNEVTDYEVFDKLTRSPFDGDKTSRINVADFIVKLVQDEAAWKQNKHRMPVIANKKK